jgi:hypothetical protein
VLKIFDTVTGNCGLTNDFFGEAAVFEFIQIELIFEAFFDYILIGNTQIWCGLAGLSCKRCNQESFPTFLLLARVKNLIEINKSLFVLSIIQMVAQLGYGGKKTHNSKICRWSFRKHSHKW